MKKKLGVIIALTAIWAISYTAAVASSQAEPIYETKDFYEEGESSPTSESQTVSNTPDSDAESNASTDESWESELEFASEAETMTDDTVESTQETLAVADDSEEPETGIFAESETGISTESENSKKPANESETDSEQMPLIQNTGMFSGALRAAARASGQAEPDDRGYYNHLVSVTHADPYCISAYHGQVNPDRIFDWNFNAYIRSVPRSSEYYGALSFQNGSYGAGAQLTAAQTAGIGPFSGRLPAYRFVCSEAQYNAGVKAYAIYKRAVGVLDRTTCTITYYDLKLTLQGFQKALTSADASNSAKKNAHATTAYFLWDPARPGIYTRQLNYADVKIEILMPDTNTAVTAAVNGFTIIKDIDQYQGIAWKPASNSTPYYETYSTSNQIRIANTGNAAAPYYAHSTTADDKNGAIDRNSWLGLSFYNGMVVTFVQTQGLNSQDGHNALAADLGGQTEIPILPPAVTLQKYVGLTANPNNGLGSAKEAFLPNYCGDTYYYRVVVTANTADFRTLIVSDTFPKWLGVTGIMVYRKSGGSWVVDTAGFPNVSTKVDASYGSSKVIDIPATVNSAKGNTYCIEYKVKAAPASEFQKLVANVSATAAHYWWTNTASVTYSYGYQGTVQSGGPVYSNQVYTYMPKPPAVSLDKYIGTNADPNTGLGSPNSVYLPKFEDNVYYYRVVATFSDSNYTSAAISDTFPEWVYVSKVKVYKRSGESWNSTTSGVAIKAPDSSYGEVKETEISIAGASAKGAAYCIEYTIHVGKPKLFPNYEHQPSKNSQCYYWDNSARLSYSYPTAGGTLEGASVTSNKVRAYLPFAPAVSLEKYVSADADINNGLGAVTCHLPNFCGDTYYYRVVAKFDAADYRSAVVTDTFPGWAGVTGIKVYKKSGESWSPTTAGVSVPQPAPSYGSSKTLEVSIAGASAKGNTYCIEYKMAVISAEGFSKLEKLPYDIGSKYSWPNEASLAYSCMSVGALREGVVRSETVYTYMPVPSRVTFEKHVSLDGDISKGLGGDLVRLPNYGGDTYYYRIVATFDDNYEYSDALIKDQFPSWLILRDTKVYKDSNGAWEELTSKEAYTNGDRVLLKEDSLSGSTYCIEYTVQASNGNFPEMSDAPLNNGAWYYWDNTATMSCYYKYPGVSDHLRGEFTTNEVRAFMPMPPVVSLEKYVSADAGISNGLGSSTRYLPDYCGDTYYYRVVASFNRVNYTGITITDTFKKWEKVTGVKIYELCGDTWELSTDCTSVTNPDTPYGSAKTVDVSVNTARAGGSTFCIEYEVRIPAAAEFESLSSRPGRMDPYYSWTNKASVSYSYDLGYTLHGNSGSGSGTKESKAVRVYMPSLCIRVYKRDKKTDLGINGAKLSLLNQEGKVVKTFTSSSVYYEVCGLASGTYTLREDKAPQGYKLAEPLTFTITPANLKTEVTMYDAPLETCTVTVRKLIKASDVIWAHGNPTFLFDVAGHEEDGTEHSYAGSVTFTEASTENPDGMLEGTYVFQNVPVGEYKVSERDVSPYTSEASVADCAVWSSSVGGSMEACQPYQQVNVTINTIGDTDRSPAVTFTNSKQAWDDYRHTDTKINCIQTE